jgi:hypothetical protein
MLGKFLHTVLPTDGKYAIVTIKDTKVVHHWFDSIDPMVRTESRALDTYFALSTFKAKSRTQKNHFKSKALWMDLDLKGTSYPSFKEMLAHAAQFYKAYNLPCPTVVFSGGGFHLYWALDTELSHDAWHVLADGLHNAAVTFGLQFDVKCTRDAARILRVPGSTNFKYDSRPMVRIVGEVREPSPLSAFEAIKGLSKPAKVGQPKVSVKSSIGEVFSNDADADFLAVNCDQIAYFKATGSDSEPHWYACANVLKHCKDGLARFLEWSSHYDGYDEESATAKFAHAVATGTGPTLCKSFESLRPEACKACKQPRHVTTPLHTRILPGREAPSNGSSPEPSEGDAALELPPILQPFELLKGVIQAATSDKQLSKSMVYEPIVSCDIRLVKRLQIVGGAETMVFKAKEVTGKDYREIAIPAGVAMGSNKVSEFAKLGVYIQDVPQWNRYVSMSINQLASTRLPTLAYDTFGWQEDGAFIIGPWKYTESGREKAELDPTIRERAKSMGTAPGGDIQGAVRVLSRVMAQMSSSQVLLYMLAMGAPLMKFIDVEEGGVVGWNFSHESGTGKSTTIEMIEASVGKLRCVRMGERDTPNAKAALFGLLKSLPVTLDDPNPTDMGGINHIMDMAVAGCDKNALNQDRTLREQPHKWRTVFVAASNNNPFDVVDAQRKRRIIGFREQPKPYLDRSQRADIQMELRTHAGWIMHELMKLYVRKDAQDYARKKVNLWVNTLDKNFKFRPEDRFNVIAVAVALTALEFVKKVASDAGEPLHIDNKAMMQVGVDAARDSMETADSSEGGSASDTLADFLAEHVSSTVTVHRSSGNGSMPKVEVPAGLRELKVIVNLKKERVIIRIRAFNDWVRAKGLSPTEVINALAREDKVISKGMPMYMGAGGHNVGTQRCLIIRHVEEVEAA